ncbi:hypothetical protein L596_030000 [Steinernema carpocapsae]|uniref:G-protein coupled receptors family 1 profile domain-containing protein n=1 Tax=Steinernema carpocapsae TaxID=34508 RepID=A0A4U5LRF7_STECR|nr:hypothetical protein L596_030000 [Steinernema carpocapsae]
MMHDTGLFSPNELTLIGYLLFFFSLISFLWYFYVVLGVCRLMKTHPSFVLIGSHCIADLWTMMQYVWLSFDIVLKNKLAASYPLATMFYNFGWYPGLFHFTVVAFNRTHIVLDPVKHDRFWTQRISILFATLSWTLGCLLSVTFSYILPAESSAYYIYVPVNFAKKTGESLQENMLLYTELSINAATLIPLLVAYVFSLAYSLQLTCRQHFGKAVDQITLFTKKPKTQKGNLKWNVQQRLWIICIFNLMPSAIHVFFLTFQPHTSTGILALFRSFFGLFATMIPSVLLPLFSTLVRKNLPFMPQKACVTTVAPFTMTESSSRLRAAQTTFGK